MKSVRASKSSLLHSSVDFAKLLYVSVGNIYCTYTQGQNTTF